MSECHAEVEIFVFMPGNAVRILAMAMLSEYYTSTLLKSLCNTRYIKHISNKKKPLVYPWLQIILVLTETDNRE